MDRNKVILAIILVLTIFSLVIGITNISLFSKKSKLSINRKGEIISNFEEGVYLIKIHGEIHSGESTLSSTGSNTILAKLSEIKDQPNIKGILIEINSPGGTVGASQEIYNYLMEIRKTKKIVVSMKDVAASGGYYIASAADFIFALNGTVTGSIGVVSVIPNIKGLLDKYGVKIKTYKAGKYKDIMSMFRESTVEEEGIMQKFLDQVYNAFIEDVAKGRGKSVNVIEELAQGKIYSGEEAFRLKLIDGIGGREEALKKLGELCQYSGEIPLIEEEENPFDKLFMMFGGASMSLLNKQTDIPSRLFQSGVLVVLPNYLGNQL